EQSKRRRLLRLAAGLLIAVLLCGIAGTSLGLVWAETKRREAEKAWTEEGKRREEAEQARDQSRRRYQLALDAFNDLVFGIQNKLKVRPGTQDLRKDLLE